MDKVTRAENATAEIQRLAREASNVLLNGKDGRILVNFLGVFSEPWARESDLRIAKEKIDQALNLYSQTNWPSSQDYDHAY